MLSRFSMHGHAEMVNKGFQPEIGTLWLHIDLLARAEKFQEARFLLKYMKMEPDRAIWGSLVSGCNAHGRVELGEYRAECLFQLEPENAGPYLCFCRIFMQELVDGMMYSMIRRELNDERMKKVPGCTSKETHGVVHEFLAGDNFYPECRNIYTCNVG